MARGNLYLRVYDDLKRKIETGQIPKGSLIDSERDLITHYEVSRVTLRKSLGMLVKDKYLHCKPSIGYEVSYEKKLKQEGNQNLLIGIIFNNASSTDGIKFLEKLENTAASNGYSFLIGFNQYKISLENDCLLRFQQHNIKGLILSPAINGSTKPIATKLIEKKFPIIFLGDMEHWQKDYAHLENKMYIITDDSAQAISLSLEHLKLTNHENILFAGSQSTPYETIRKKDFISKYKAIKRNAEKYTIEINADLISEIETDLLKKTIQELGITAIISYNDNVTQALFKILKIISKKIRRKIAIINIGKTIQVSDDYVDLTTVETDDNLWCEQIILSLKSQIEGKTWQKATKIPYSLHYQQLSMN